MDAGELTESEKKIALALGFDLKIVGHVKSVVRRPFRSYKDLYNCDDEGRDPRRYLRGHLERDGMVSITTKKRAYDLNIAALLKVQSHSPTAKKALSDLIDKYRAATANLKELSAAEESRLLKFSTPGLLFDVETWSSEQSNAIRVPGYDVQKVDRFSVQKDFGSRAEAENYRIYWPWKDAKIHDFSQRAEITSLTVVGDNLANLQWDGNEEVLANGDGTFNVHRHSPFRVITMIQSMLLYKT